jgi:uncharacterized protein YcbK (DUF882 family)
MQPYVVRVLILIAASSPALLCERVSADAHSPMPDESGEEIQPAAAAEETPAPRKTPSVKRSVSHKKTPATKAIKHRERQPTAEYQHMRDGWHAAVPAEPIADLDVRRPLVIAPVNSNGGEQVSIVPQRDDGGFTDADLRLAARAFTPKGRLKPHPIAPHLLDLVYRAMTHFDAPLVHLVSGYRPDRAGSRHTQGRAIDMVIPGVSNEQLAEYLRQFGFVGVGVYPKSGFVHLDVRENSFFWLDNSLPDERCRAEPTLVEEAKRMDTAARDRGEKPEAFVPNNEREDRAAARSYQRRAAHRKAAAEAKLFQPL